MILISNLILSVEDGSTIASTEIYGKDKKTYINIGSGNVFKLSWETPTLMNEAVDHYSLIIKRFDPTLNVYYDILDKNIGLVNEFYVDSHLLPTLPEQYILSIYIVAYYKSGSAITSNIVNPYITKGSGTYVKVKKEDYAQSLMKRALAFAKVVTVLKADDGFELKDIDGKTLVTLGVSGDPITVESKLMDLNKEILLDPDGNELFANATKLLTSTSGWEVVQEGYTRGSDDEWHTNDIRYEMLISTAEGDDYGKPIEVIVDNDTNGNPIYEPLYVL